MSDRRSDLDRFYELLGQLRAVVGGTRSLRNCDGRMDWPEQGLYFFFEEWETREDGREPRVTRVGTHGLHGSSTTLRSRLRQHRGSKRGRNPGGGNHRGSVFRLHVGTALLRRGEWPDELAETWASGPSASRDVREREYALERAVSDVIGRMPFLSLAVPDQDDGAHDRGLLERNTIALLSNYERPSIDPPSSVWLGRSAASLKIRRSGLWNVNHVEETHDRAALELFEQYVMHE